jgi:hypothetical protein
MRPCTVLNIFWLLVSGKVPLNGAESEARSVLALVGRAVFVRVRM